MYLTKTIRRLGSEEMLCNSIDEECNKMYKDGYELVTYYFHPDYIYMTFKKIKVSL